MNPFFWLGISIALVAISLAALLTVAILVLRELSRAARSAEKLLDTLNRELPTTLQDLRLTGKDLSDLSEEVSGSMQSARSVAQQIDRSLLEAKAQAQRAQLTTRSFVAGATAAFRVLTKPKRRRRRPPVPPETFSPARRPPSNSQIAQQTPQPKRKVDVVRQAAAASSHAQSGRTESDRLKSDRPESNRATVSQSEARSKENATEAASSANSPLTNE